MLVSRSTTRCADGVAVAARRNRQWRARAALACVVTLLISRPAPGAECGVERGVILHGLRNRNLVALTFDACPTSHSPGFSPEIADRLQEASVPATFFVSGRWAEAHPHDLERLASNPLFEIALHGYRHRHLQGASSDAIFREIEDGRSALLHLGVDPVALLRPPYGEHPAALAEAARRAGVLPVLWDVAPGDPDPHETEAALERDVFRSVRGGSIIVLHVNGRGVATAAALPALLRSLPERGFHFAKVSDLIRPCTASAARTADAR